MNEKSDRERQLETELAALKEARRNQQRREKELELEQARIMAEREAQRIALAREPNRKRMAEFKEAFRELCERFDVYLEGNSSGYDQGWTDAIIGSGETGVREPIDE